MRWERQRTSTLGLAVVAGVAVVVGGTMFGVPLVPLVGCVSLLVIAFVAPGEPFAGVMALCVLTSRRRLVTVAVVAELIAGM